MDTYLVYNTIHKHIEQVVETLSSKLEPLTNGAVDGYVGYEMQIKWSPRLKAVKREIC